MPISIPEQMETASRVKDYIIDRRMGLIILTSNVTDKSFYYHISQTRWDKTLHFVWVETCNGKEYVGAIKDNKKFGATKKSLPVTDLRFKVFDWTWRHVFNNSLPKSLSVYHYNTCSRCGRKLRDPKSIERGIGPECVKMIANGY